MFIAPHFKKTGNEGENKQIAIDLNKMINKERGQKNYDIELVVSNNNNRGPEETRINSKIEVINEYKNVNGGIGKMYIK